MSYGPKATFYEQTSDRQLNDLQVSIDLATRNFQHLMPLTGAYVTTIADSTGVQVPIQFAQNTLVRVVHNLGYAYTGWIIASVGYVSGAAVAPLILVSSADETGETKKSSIALINVAANTVTAHVWVY